MWQNQQQIFVTSFYCFLNYDTKKDFVVDFDSAWKWAGFSRKDPAKRLLEKCFIIDIDYQVKNTSPPFGGKVEMGRPVENILLTVNTFKKFCLKAGTKKADEIHDYYIKLEELLHETVNEETNELRLQLTNTEQEKKLEHNLKNEVVQRQILKAKYERFLDRRIDIDKFEKRSCVYILCLLCYKNPNQ